MYSWTLALRCARRLITLCTTSLGPSLSPPTRSHRSMIAPQSSEVRFSSVALAIHNERISQRECISTGSNKSTAPQQRGWGRVTYRRPRHKAQPLLLGTWLATGRQSVVYRETEETAGAQREQGAKIGWPSSGDERCRLWGGGFCRDLICEDCGKTPVVVALRRG